MSHDVFISYTSKDKAAADLLCNHLENLGIRVWYAPRDIHDRGYADAIVFAINKAKVFALVMSGESTNSDHVLNEIALAHDRMKAGLAILPIRIDDADISPPSKYYLGRQHWLDASTPPLEDKIKLFCENVKSLLSKDGSENVQQSLSSQARGKPTKSYQYSNPKDRYLYEVGEVELSTSQLSKIEENLSLGEVHIDNASRGTVNILDLAWIRSFTSIIREIDPLGFSGFYSGEQSNSLVGEWDRAKYTRHSSHDIEVMKLSAMELDAERFGNYLSILFGLQGGTANIVINKRVNQSYVETKSSYDNPLYHYEYEYGLVDISEEKKLLIKNKLEAGRNHIATVENGLVGPVQMAWIKSFGPIIRSIDHKGFSGNYSNEQSNSLIGEWHFAQYTSYSSFDVETMQLSESYLNSIIFGKYLSIIYSLLVGKALVVLDRREIKSAN